MPLLAKDLLFDALKTVNLPPEKAVVAVLGLAYKGGDSDDTRNSPALTFVDEIRDEVAEVRTHDPLVGGTHENLEDALRGGRTRPSSPQTTPPSNPSTGKSSEA